jgi:chromosome segregation ATPase
MNKINLSDTNLALKKEKLNVLKNELDTNKNLFVKISEENDLIHENIQYLEAEYLNTKKDLELVKTQINEKIQSKNNNRLKLQKIFEESLVLKKKIEDFQNRIKNLDQDLLIIEDIFRERNFDHTELQTQFNDLNSKIVNAKLDYQNKRQQIDFTENENQILKIEIDSLVEEMQKVEKLEKVTLISIADVQQSNSAAHEKHSFLTQDVSNKIKMLHKQTLLLKSQEEKFEKLQNTNNELNFNQLRLEELRTQSVNLIKLNELFFSSIVRADKSNK